MAKPGSVEKPGLVNVPSAPLISNTVHILVHAKYNNTPIMALYLD